jgi:hypothetical protein
MRILRFNELVLEKSIGSESIRMKWYSDMDKKVFYQLVNLDPTSVRKKEFSKPGKYSKWLINQFKKGSLTQELLNDSEFTNKLNYYLFIFSTGWYKSRILSDYGKTFFDEETFWRSRTDNNYISSVDDEKKYTKSSSIYYDITKYKTVSEFIKHMQKYVSTYEIETEKSKFDVVFSDEKISILVPLNFTASRETAENTEWCSQSIGGYSVWNRNSILFRIVPMSKDLDRVKLTWSNSRWYMAPQKYPEIFNGNDSNNWRPFDKSENGKEIWETLVEENEKQFPNEKNLEHWKKLRDTISLLSDKAKETINHYWEQNIKNKQ